MTVVKVKRNKLKKISERPTKKNGTSPCKEIQEDQILIKQWHILNNVNKQQVLVIID